MSTQVDRVIPDLGQLLESPLWDASNGCLYWCDILNQEVHRLHVDSGARQRWTFDGPVGSLGLAESGRLVVSVADSVYLFDTGTGEQTLVAKVIDDWPTQRLNDGKVGPDGAFWVGSMDNREPTKLPIAAIYRVTADGTCTSVVESVTIANGIAWSPDGRSMYYCDSRGPWITRAEFDPATGALGKATKIRTLTNEEGRPDGGATDLDGFYWSAGVSANCLNRFAPDGNLVETIPLPFAYPTMPCFGGADMKTLYVTSLRVNLTPEQREKDTTAGSLYKLKADVAGTPVHKFRDVA